MNTCMVYIFSVMLKTDAKLERGVLVRGGGARQACTHIFTLILKYMPPITYKFYKNILFSNVSHACIIKKI